MQQKGGVLIKIKEQEIQQLLWDLGGGYTDILPLDEGGMGTLFRAHKKSLDVDVVIKKVKSKYKGKLNERSEANILKNLKHKYLPRIYDVIESESGYIYTIMDLIPGTNLQSYIKEHGPADQKTAYKWACQLCEVTEYLHAQKPPIIHCDIKPSNVMITPDLDICLIDFNTSLIFSDGMLAIGATPGYAAPEQYTRPSETTAFVPAGQPDGDETMPAPAIGNHRVYPLGAPEQGSTGTANATVTNATAAGTASQTTNSSSVSFTAAQSTSAGGYGTISKRTDIYSIGATLYYTMTGVKPNRSLEPVKPITSYRLKMSRTLLSIVQRAMQKQPSDRFFDAHEMLRALQDIRYLDARYKHVMAMIRTAAAVEVVCLAIGGFCTVYGLNRIQQERQADYYSAVTKARTCAEQTQFDKAEDYLDDAIRLYDDRLEAYAEQAVVLYRKGRYAECIDAVNSIFARTLFCDDAQEWANVCYVAANSFYELADYDSACTWYQKAIVHSPRISAYYRDYAIAQLKAGKNAEAEQTLQAMTEAVTNAADSVDYQMICAERTATDGDPAAAFEQLAAITQQTDDVQILNRAYVLAAQACEKIGDEALGDEIELLEQADARLDNYYGTLVRSYLCTAYARQAVATGDTDYLQKALDAYTALFDSGMNTFSVRLNIAVLQENLRRYSDAEETLLQLAEDYPEDYRVYMRLSYLEADVESNKSGTADYTKAKSYYAQAKQFYEIAQAAGADDPEMLRLKQLIQEMG